MAKLLHRARPPFGAGLAAALAAVVLAGCVVAPYPPPPRYPVAVARPAPAAPTQQPMYFYPELNQSEDKQDRDRYECYRWASRQSGYEPGMTPLREVPGQMSTPMPPSGPSQPGNGPYPPTAPEVAGGAITGAVIGGAMSSPRNAGAGIVLGAIFGAMVGAASSEARQRAWDQHAQAREAWDADRNQRIAMGNFRRAMAACMEGRGYRVR